MNLFGFNISRKADLGIDEIIRRLEEATRTASGIIVTPDSCQESPTVQSVVNSISMRIATLPVHVERKAMASNGRESRERLPNHPVAKLLAAPNEWQTATNYWLDAVSCLVRHGKYFAIKGRGVTGPIRRLLPVHPGSVDLSQDEQMNVRARVTLASGGQRDYSMSELHFVRGRAQDFLNGDSPVWLAREAIALEIAAQRFGASFFGNGAMPGLIFSYMEGIKGHMNAEQRSSFIASISSAFGRGGNFKALMLPYGIGKPEQMTVENDKAQFLETRKLQRSVIAGAFGVPPHLVGDLDRATFSNIESQSQEFVQKVVLPYVRIFEDAMERDLLTDEDRRAGIAIRFNLDGALRADFKTRQEGLNIQRMAGVISANEWREAEHMNPRDGGDEYYEQGPSGQNAVPAEAEDGAEDADEEPVVRP